MFGAKIGRFGKLITNEWKVLNVMLQKDRLIVRKMLKYYVESTRKKCLTYSKKKEG